MLETPLWQGGEEDLRKDPMHHKGEDQRRAEDHGTFRQAWPSPKPSQHQTGRCEHASDDEARRAHQRNRTCRDQGADDDLGDGTDFFLGRFGAHGAPAEHFRNAADQHGQGKQANRRRRDHGKQARRGQILPTENRHIPAFAERRDGDDQHHRRHRDIAPGHAISSSSVQD